MAGLTDNGLVIKRLPDILEELETSLRSYLGNDIDLSENTLLGVLNTIYAASLAEEWELAQAIYDSFNVDTSSGKQLDDLVALLKLKRLQPTKSTGSLSLFGASGTIVPIGTQFSDAENNAYINTEQGILSTGTSRTPIAIGTTNGTGTVGDPSIIYTVQINSDIYSHQFIWPNVDLITVSDTLATIIGDRATYRAESFTADSPEFITQSIPVSGGQTGIGLNIINKDANNSITILVSVTQSPTPSHYLFDEGGIVLGTAVSTFTDTVSVEAVNTGSINTPLNTLINIDTPVAGLVSVNNVESVNVGRALESDEELRARFKSNSALNAYATTQSTQSKLAQLEGVSKVLVTENNTSVVDSEGRSPHSYECLVVGGDDTDIATSIWNNKPSGIATYGNTSININDNQGVARVINFSRPTEIFVWVKVQYSKYSEEVFPINGNSLIQQAALAYGQSLDLGEDVIPTRFYGSIYNSTSGIGGITVLLATGDAITEPPIGNFQEVTIDISGQQQSVFSLARVEVIEV